MDSYTSHLQPSLKPANIIVLLAGFCLIGYLILLLGTTYISQNSLRDAALSELKHNLDKQATALSYFYSERKNDLTNLAKNRALEVYFANKRLGLSMEYGLQASLFAMDQVFAELMQSKKLGKADIYLSLLFLDNDDNILIERGPMTSRIEPPSHYIFTAPNDYLFHIIQTDDHSHTFLIVPYFHKQKREGAIVAEINTKELLKAMLHLGESSPEYALSVIDDPAS
ncbi:MAG: hypothetical protein MI754_17760, partial [Chromatiales bacterium]|nr:hypothetical protein [Chromatiales bacterium]